jgi:PAS domain-containing protein
MTPKTSLRLERHEANEVLATLLSQNHGWWCDVIEDYVDKNGKTRQRLANTPYYSPAFLAMYGYTLGEVSLEAVIAEKHQHSVVRAMKVAMKPGSHGASGTISARTKEGTEKLVEVYVRRIELPDGRFMLASLHSDLTISTDVQWIDRTVLRKLQAFVFVKRWDKSSGRFLFTYMNDLLAYTLGLSEPEQGIGKSDEDFFEDEAQRAGFRWVDEAIRDASDPDLVIVREEGFAPGSIVNITIGNHDTRLLTFKTPFWPPSQGPHTGEWEVLGIAVNVTSVTDVMRAIADRSDNALYIKDQNCRYQYVNQQFLSLIGATHERQVLNRTFSEALRNLKTSGNYEALEALVYAEDRQVLAGQPTVSVRTASLHDGTESLSEKQPIRSRDGEVSHILGVTSQLFPGKLGRILDKIPQCLAVKKYSPPDAGSSGEFKYVWANQSFLRRHNMGLPKEVIGKTDYDFWPMTEADKYRKKDREVIEAYRQALPHADLCGTLSTQDWEKLVEALREAKCWEYRETQRGQYFTRILQTSKWAESIEGTETLFLVVVYSDVTKGDAEQQRYHELTVHNMKGAIAPAAVARMYLEDCLAGTRAADEAIREAIECISDISENSAFFLKHHLNVLRMKIECVPRRVGDLFEVAREEAVRARRLWGMSVRVLLDADVSPDLFVHCDAVFMRFVLAETILNAMKAVDCRITHYKARMELARGSGNGALIADTYAGKVMVRFRKENMYLTCTISDNGIACLNDDERKKLEESYAAARNDPYEPYTVKLGLPFCVIAMQAQKGEFRLDSDDIVTSFSICIPLSSGGGVDETAGLDLR